MVPGVLLPGHGVGAVKAHNVKVRGEEVQNVRMAVIGQNDVAVPRRRGAQAVVEPDVVPEVEGGGIHPLRLQIGRVRVDHRAGPGVLPDYVAAVLVLHHHALE